MKRPSKPLTRREKVFLGVVSCIVVIPILIVLFPSEFVELAFSLTGLVDHFVFSTKAPRTLLVESVFTEQAYQPDGWYYKNVTTVKFVQPLIGNMTYSGTRFAFDLYKYSFSTTDDIEVSNDPSILGKYDKIVLLHNEYVTKSEYQAIMAHHNIIYLYPNALARFVDYNAKDNTITLKEYTGNFNSVSNFTRSDGIRVNEFDRWESGYKVINYPNGAGLNCYPFWSLMNNATLRDQVFNFQ